MRKITNKKIGSHEYQITKWHTENHFLKQIQLNNPTTGIPRHLSTEKVAKFSLGDFAEMLSFQHLQIVEVFGNYNLERYDINTSPRMIIVAKKGIKTI